VSAGYVRSVLSILLPVFVYSLGSACSSFNTCPFACMHWCVYTVIMFLQYVVFSISMTHFSPLKLHIISTVK
jgi:hypothetical protein